MTTIDLAMLSPADRALVDEALRRFGGEVVAIKMPPAQPMLPLEKMMVEKPKKRGRRSPR